MPDLNGYLDTKNLSWTNSLSNHSFHEYLLETITNDAIKNVAATMNWSQTKAPFRKYRTTFEK